VCRSLEEQETSQRWTGCGWNPFRVVGAGVVLHQPLIRRIFVKNGIFGQNMNGIPVSPGPKMQNAPTWQVENTPVGAVFFWSGDTKSCPNTTELCLNDECSQMYSHPRTEQVLLFLFYARP